MFCTGFSQDILKLREQHRSHPIFDIRCVKGALSPNDLGHEHLWVTDLEGVGPKALEKSHAQSHTWISDNNRLRSAPLFVGKFLHRNKVNFGRKRGAIVEGFADKVYQQWNVGRRNRMTTCLKYIQRISVTEKHCALRLPYNYL